MCLGLQDHKLIHSNLNLKVATEESKLIQYRDFRYFSIERFNSDLNSKNWLEIVNTADIGEKLNILSKNIFKLFKHHAPTRTVMVIKPEASFLMS